MNYSLIASRLRAKIAQFSGELCGSLGKIPTRLVMEMIYGLVASQSVLLTDIARTLEEKIGLRKTHGRLSRNLQTRGIGENVEKELLEHASGRVREDTLLIVDPSDLTKKYAEKMEYLTTVRDGSDDTLGSGYHLLHIVGCEVNGDSLVPLILRLYSSEAPGYGSENHQILSAIDGVRKACGGRGIYVMDRGGDRRNLLVPLLERGVRFIVRQTGNRHVLSGRRKKSVAEWAETCECPYTEVVSKVEDGREKTYRLTFGCRKVRLPEQEAGLTLLVVHGFGKKPLMLLIHGDVQKSRKSLWRWIRAYLKRWTVEETIRCVKQCYNVENVRLLTYRSLCNLMPLLNAALYFTAVLIGPQSRIRVTAGYVLKAAKRLFGIPHFGSYALSDGLRSIFQRHPRRPHELLPKKQSDLPLFADLGP